MKWREMFQLITKRSYAEPKQYYFRHSIENHSNTMFIEYIQVNASKPFHLRPSTNVARIRFPEETSCGLSLLLVLVLVRRVFLWVLRCFSLHKNKHFQIPVRSGNSRSKNHLVDTTLPHDNGNVQTYMSTASLDFPPLINSCSASLNFPSSSRNMAYLR